MTSLHILPHLIWRLRTATFSPAAAIQSERRSLLDPALTMPVSGLPTPTRLTGDPDLSGDPVRTIPVSGDEYPSLAAQLLIDAFLSLPWTTGSATPSGDSSLECSPTGGSLMTSRMGELMLGSRVWKAGRLPPPIGAGAVLHMVGISEETNGIFSADGSRLIISRGIAARVIVADTLISRCSSATCL